MTDSSAAERPDLVSTYAYCAELNPLRMQLPFVNFGFAPPQVRVACEIGFAHGISANIHAAASNVQWWGTEADPERAAFAQQAIAASQSDVRLSNEALHEFCARPDLPDFDAVGLNGIFSWISDESRSVLVDFLRRKLKTGGVVYVSYETMPGWAAMLPLRHLLTQHASLGAGPGRATSAHIEAAAAFAEQVLATEPLSLRAFPQMQSDVAAIRSLNRHELAGEYVNPQWPAMPIAQMAQWLAPANLAYACPAHSFDQIDALNLTAEQRAIVNDIRDPVFRETVRDFIVNRAFRRDYWIKGARRLTALEQTEAARRQRFVLVEQRSRVSLTAVGALGAGAMQEAIYGPILDVFAEQAPHTVGELEEQLRPGKITLAQIVEAMLVLVGNGSMQPAQDEAATAQAAPVAGRLNAFLLEKARSAGDNVHLASPLTGGGVFVPRLEQLFLLARSRGEANPQDWAAFCWQLLSAQGHRVLKDGKPLAKAQDNIRELTRQAGEFADQRLPILKALRIA